LPSTIRFGSMALKSSTLPPSFEQMTGPWSAQGSAELKSAFVACPMQERFEPNVEAE
jgi:hypothetical protein